MAKIGHSRRSEIYITFNEIRFKYKFLYGLWQSNAGRLGWIAFLLWQPHYIGMDLRIVLRQNCPKHSDHDFVSSFWKYFCIECTSFYRNKKQLVISESSFVFQKKKKRNLWMWISNGYDELNTRRKNGIDLCERRMKAQVSYIIHFQFLFSSIQETRSHW